MSEPVKYKYPPVHALREWLEEASPEVKNLLAELAKASKDMRQQWITGRRAMSAEKAGNLVDAMLVINKQIPDAPVPLTRGDLCAACSKCPHYLREQEEI
jgi:hypothetical protein